MVTIITMVSAVCDLLKKLLFLLSNSISIFSLSLKVLYCEDFSPGIQRWFGGALHRLVGKVPDEE